MSGVRITVAVMRATTPVDEDPPENFLLVFRCLPSPGRVWGESLHQCHVKNKLEGDRIATDSGLYPRVDPIHSYFWLRCSAASCA